MSNNNNNNNNNNKMSNIEIRLEKPEDYHKVEEVTRDAFWNLYFPGCNEHVVIHKLRNHPDVFVSELAFVILLDDEIVGSIFYSKSKIVLRNKDKPDIPTICLGPVSIDPKYHRKGLGRKLIEHSIEEAKKLGQYKAIMLLGYPYHYKPYGFVSSKKYNISTEDGKFLIGQQVLPLEENALDDVCCDGGGYFQFSSEVFEPSVEEVETYDKNFPPKIKKVNQDSQKEFEIACQMIDES